MRQFYLLSLCLISCLFCNAQTSTSFNWVKQMGYKYQEISTSHVAGIGNTNYHCGVFEDTFSLSTNDTIISDAYNNNMVLIKSDNNGVTEWTKQFYSSSSVSKGKLYFYDDYLYVAGDFRMNIWFEDSSNIISAKGETDFFVCKIDQGGNLIWMKTFGSAGMDYSSGISVYQNSIIMTGSYFGTIDFDPDTANYQNHTSKHNTFDGFLLCLDTNGKYSWSYSIECSHTLFIHDLAVDSNRDIYITGRNFGSIFLPNHTISNPFVTNSSGFILRFDKHGSYIRSYDFYPRQLQGIIFLDQIDIDNNDNILLAGSFYGEVDFDPGAGQNKIVNNENGTDGFILKLNQSGNLQWVIRNKTNVNNIGPQLMNIDIYNNVYITGSFQATTIFDHPKLTSLLTSKNRKDIFILKLTESGQIEWVNQIGGLGDELPASIDVNNTGNITLTGSFENSTDFDPNPTNHILSSLGEMDMFLLELTQPNFSAVAELYSTDFNIYPVPANETLRFSEISNNMVITFFDINGKDVSDRVKRIDMSTFSIKTLKNGIYLVKIANEGNAVVKKIIKI